MRSVKYSIWNSRTRYEDGIEKSLIVTPLDLTPAGKRLSTHLWEELLDGVDTYVREELMDEQQSRLELARIRPDQADLTRTWPGDLAST